MGFTRQVVLTYFVRILLIPVGLLYSVVTARWLGPGGLGVFAAIGAILGTTSQLGNLGLTLAAGRFAAESEDNLPPLVANARVTGALSGCVLLAALAGLYGLLPSVFGAVPRSLLLLAALALPLTFASAQFQAVLLGRQRVREYNLMQAMDRGLLLVGAIVTLVILGLGLRGLVFVTVVIAMIHYAVYHVLLWPASARFAPDLQLARRMGGFSGRAYVGTLLAFLVLRSDILLLNVIRGLEDTGLYAIAVRPVDFLLLLPGVAGAMLFPRIAASRSRGSARLTAKVARHVALFMTVACAAVAAVAWWVIPALFGPAYQASVLPLWILLPGVWCMAIQGIIANDLVGRDYPPAMLAIWSTLLAANVGLNLIWIPKYGIAGAAASSTVAYGLSLVLIGRYWLRRFDEIRTIDLFRLRREEIRSMFDRVMRVLRPVDRDAGVSTPESGSS